MSEKIKLQDYWTKNYLNYEQVVRETIEYTEKVKNITDIFIITKKNVIFVTNSGKEVLDYITQKKSISNYEKIGYVQFLKDFCKETNKYRTYKNQKIWKYHKTLKLGSKNDKRKIKEMVKDPLVKIFFREVKLERILGE